MVRFAPLVVASSLTSCACANLIEDAAKLPLSSEHLQNDIKLPALQKHAKALQGFADKSNGTRVFGSTGYNASVDYVAEIVKQAGYDVELQTFPYEYNEVLVQKFVAESLVNISGMAVSLVYNNVEGALPGTLGAPNATAYIPIGGIDRTAGESLAQKLLAGLSINATLEILTFSEERYSSNVIATSKGGNQSNIVFIGSHLDSVNAGPGINDNGSGSITVLELAVQLAKYKLNNAVRFAWWTAEEFGLVGSSYYIENLPKSEREKIALYINLDMVASPNYVLAVYDGDGSAGTNPGPTPAGSGAIEKVFTDYFASKNLSSVPTSFDGRSDYGPFIADGINIPSGGLFTGAEGIKTEEQAKLFGGTAGVAYDVNYHAKGDTYDNLNFEAFLINAKASAHGMAIFIESTAAVEAEKAPANVSSKVAANFAAAPGDALVVQGKHICAGELA
ncbi:Peptidase family M28 protein [Rhizoctonia solani]|uniref:Peptide hydrolase n=1 Tax=Rhizoctonia solani TaxID=456999 RepID=A0A8H8NSQ8_9AGAM|nr:Peptidase family M28 protein [Rhizoctonia solani]QRW18082.1 Peptidase family M28 protein [Rhizoctonia solani]